jgi:DNA polymerase alpha subunit B
MKLLISFAGNNPHIRIFLIPSILDAFHDPTFPQRPFEDVETADNITFLPNPAYIFLNEIFIVISTNDIIFHLSAEELFKFLSSN